jgi:ATP adenylyltransferase
VRDKYPVTTLHTLVISKRHTPTFFDLFEPERRAINQLLDKVRVDIMQKDASVRGFNVGMNNGEVAGQTVSHAHVHLIPRRQGDVQDPRGGVGLMSLSTFEDNGATLKSWCFWLAAL